MDIIKRNFLRTLRSGAFNDIEPFEPMSVFKWNKLLTMIVSQNVIPVAIKGMKNCQYENIPYTTIQTFFKNCNIDKFIGFIGCMYVLFRGVRTGNGKARRNLFS